MPFLFLAVNCRNAILDFFMCATPHAHRHLHRSDANKFMLHYQDPFKRFLVFVVLFGLPDRHFLCSNEN